MISESHTDSAAGQPASSLPCGTTKQPASELASLRKTSEISKAECSGIGEEAFGAHEAALPEDVAAILPGEGGKYARRLVRLALDEDGPDLTSLGVFAPDDQATAIIVAKQDTLVAGLPLASLVFAEMGLPRPTDCWEALVREGEAVTQGTIVARFWGSTSTLLKAERVILNLMTHLSGVANLTRTYADKLEGTGVRLLDTRKTLPGHRYLEKYAVRVGGGYNHRMNLADMLMLKDNHIDAAGSIESAVSALRKCYSPCPPIEVECRTQDEVRSAVSCRPDRILLDNMTPAMLAETLPLIPADMEAEISGGVDLSTIRTLALACPSRPADFISVGRITHSAPVADFSMRMERCVACHTVSPHHTASPHQGDSHAQ